MMGLEPCGNHVWSSSKEEHQLKLPVTLSGTKEEQVHGTLGILSALSMALATLACLL